MNSKDKEGENTRVVIACKAQAKFFKKKHVADKFSNELVDNKLAACVNHILNRAL